MMTMGTRGGGHCNFIGLGGLGKLWMCLVCGLRWPHGIYRCSMILGLGVNGGSTFDGTPRRHNMFGCRRVVHLHLGR